MLHLLQFPLLRLLQFLSDLKSTIFGELKLSILLANETLVYYLTDLQDFLEYPSISFPLILNPTPAHLNTFFVELA